MLIQPFKKYVVLCKGPDQKIYRWYLDVQPNHKAWKIVNEDIKVGEKFKGYFILSIDDITNDMSNSNQVQHKKDPFKEFKKPVSIEQFDFDSIPSYSYTCQICGGVVRNDICTTCMFDWDS
ncbi:hypothetical protein HNQ82_002145 [Anoxybacillus tengchongensis]|uniref:Uncharacterized protein n=1 Tax=Anoxybacillus tengchongensis TaxID=576944 RepID=A0A7W9YS22_9BACL|nr:hypothetical protein [Anoxybacillus tengchongensis]MBB6177312.1 hypothetical protein [Anoxybacillus tengchongensis]